jgi:hypothetical protein
VKKILLTALTLTLVIGGATVVFAAVDDQSSGTATTATVRTAATTAGDVSGPCDEAEHANDPRCAPGNGRHHAAAGDKHGGVQGNDANAANEAEIGEDVSGPCDEAEHANDPRCAPGVPAGQAGEDEGADDDPGEVDNSGPGSVNSGPGSTSSGPSDEADDHGGDNDHSGSGSGDEGDDD